MGNIVKQWIPAGIAIVACVLTLLPPVRDVMVEGAIIVAAFAFLLGLLNVGRVHVNKALHEGESRIHSIVLLLAALLAFGVTFVSVLPNSPQAAQFAADAIFNYVISPVGASLAALMAVALTLAAFRMLQVRRDWKAVVFVLVTVVVMVTSIPLAGLDWTPFAGLRGWVVDVFGMAGMRGLLLGVVLGTVVTAMRTLVWPRSDS
jgi:hypothetical protein